MRIASGSTSNYIGFVATDAVDLTTRLDGLTNFTVRRARNGAASVAMTTPTVVADASIPGGYWLLLDEDTTLGEYEPETQEMMLHITGDDGGGNDMVPVTRTVEIFTPSEGGAGGGATAQEVWEYATRTLTALDEDNTTLDIDAAVRAAVGLASANLDTQIADLPTNSELTSALGGLNDLDAAGVRAAVGLAAANLDTQLADLPTNSELSTALAAADDAVLAAISTVDGNVDLILADTNELQGDWADGGRLDLILDARASQASVDDVPTNSELATALAAADDAVLAAISGLPSPLDAAGTRAAVGLAAANLDTQLGDLPTNSELATALAGADDAVLAAIAALPDAATIASAVMAEEVETGVTVLQSMRGFLSIMVAPWSEAGGVYTWRDVGNTKDRIVATVGDASRGAPTLDLD